MLDAVDHISQAIISGYGCPKLWKEMWGEECDHESESRTTAQRSVVRISSPLSSILLTLEDLDASLDEWLYHGHKPEAIDAMQRCVCATYLTSLADCFTSLPGERKKPACDEALGRLIEREVGVIRELFDDMRTAFKQARTAGSAPSDDDDDPENTYRAKRFVSMLGRVAALFKEPAGRFVKSSRMLLEENHDAHPEFFRVVAEHRRKEWKDWNEASKQDDWKKVNEWQEPAPPASPRQAAATATVFAGATELLRERCTKMGGKKGSKEAGGKKGSKEVPQVQVGGGDSPGCSPGMSPAHSPRHAPPPPEPDTG